jgi:endothelin-converting enzyme/putative endopeptidase
VLELETRIAKGHWERHETRDVQRTYNLTTHDELRTLLPAFDWSAYAEAVSGSDRAFGDTLLAEVVVRQPSFFTHLQEVLTETPLEAFKELLVVKVLRSTAGYLSSEFVETNFDFYGRTLNGTPELRARWKRGVALVEGAIGEAVGKEYVARHFPPSSKAMMDELVANLLAAYRDSISRLDWMTEETKQRAYRKLETFRPKIGYPDEFRDYSRLEVSAEDLLGNVRAVAAFENDRELGKIGGPVDRDEWFMLPQHVNAYYNPGMNEICFPAAILQAPFFDADAEPAENYGGIGAVIGHEVGHGFDDQGSQYDERGNMENWWTAEDREAFQARADKLIKQYDGFEPAELPGEHVNGALTVGENIGDLGGITIALKAYLISLEGQEAPVVDGLTGQQRVFLNFAHVWRSKRRKEQMLQLITVDPHSPAEFRANIVRNLDEFVEAFDVRPGDGLWLDPEDRVRIW